MFSKFFLVIVLALFSIGQAWDVVPNSYLPSLNNDIYFRKGLQACQQKISEANKTFKAIYFIRTGVGYQYNLNDTDNNVHICRVIRLAPPVYVNMILYSFVNLNQGKLAVSDLLDAQLLSLNEVQNEQKQHNLEDSVNQYTTYFDDNMEVSIKGSALSLSDQDSELWMNASLDAIQEEIQKQSTDTQTESEPTNSDVVPHDDTKQKKNLQTQP